MLVWRYHVVILKLLHCNSITVFFLYFYLSKHETYKPLWSWLLHFRIIINFPILWKTNIVFCVWKTTCWKSWMTLLLEFWKVEHVKFFLTKQQYYNRKNYMFLFTDVLSVIYFLKKSWRKKLLNDLAKFLFTTSR